MTGCAGLGPVFLVHEILLGEGSGDFLPGSTLAPLSSTPHIGADDMELRHLRYFIAVAEELSFTRAAERLHIAQPPLSTQIRALEEELGTPLFIREKRKVFLTQAGIQMLDRARAVLSAVQDVHSAARSAAEGIIATLNLGYTASSMFTMRVPRAVRAFRVANPASALQLSEMTSADQIYALDDRTLDVGILRHPDIAIPSGVLVERWHQAPLVAALPSDHPLAGQDAIRIADLRDTPLITYPRDSGIGLYWRVLELCVKAGFRPRVMREARDPSVMIGLVSAGVGFAVVPQDTQCIRLDNVSYVRILGKDAVSTLYLAFRSGSADPHTRRLLAALRAKPI